MIIKHGNIALPNTTEFASFDLEINHGEITSIGKDLQGTNILNATGLQIFPGAIDPHVHFDDPGFTDREDFYHGSCAAASGGITTVIDMPCTSIPPVTSLKNFKKKLDIVCKKSVIDFGFYGGISNQVYVDNYKEVIAELSEHIMGFKSYLISGMDTFCSLTYDELADIMIEVYKHNRPVLLHAEDLNTIIEATKIQQQAGNSYENYYKSRPEKAEIVAVQNAIEAAKETGCQLHIVHIGTSDAAILLKDITNVTGETCPHYLEFNYKDFERVGGSLKTAPVVKTTKDSEKLWQYLADGTLEFVASDHAPAPPSQKNTGSAWTDYSGIPGTGTLFPYLYSEGFIKRQIPLDRFLQIISENAAKRYGFFDRKGSIEIGKDADLVFVNPKKNYQVRGEEFLSKGKLTPFESMILKGKIEKTMVRGKVVFDAKQGITAKAGFGKLIKPTNS